MAEAVRVDTGVLRPVADDVEALHGAVVTTLRRLMVALDAEGNCWGRDAAGQSFGAGYLPAALRVRVAMRQAVDRLAEIRGGVARFADAADEVENAVQSRFG
jgi:uncharacterized protein YukE